MRREPRSVDFWNQTSILGSLSLSIASVNFVVHEPIMADAEAGGTISLSSSQAELTEEALPVSWEKQGSVTAEYQRAQVSKPEPKGDTR